jgi:hypothetical protein
LRRIRLANDQVINRQGRRNDLRVVVFH